MSNHFQCGSEGIKITSIKSVDYKPHKDSKLSFNHVMWINLLLRTYQAFLDHFGTMSLLAVVEN